MRSKNVFRKSIVTVIALIFALTVVQFPDIAGAAVGDGSLPAGYVKIEETKNTIAPGISDKKIVMNTESGNQQNIVFACEVDMSKETVGFLAGYKNYDGSVPGLQTTTDQAAAAEKATGQNIVAAINADYFDMTNGAPIGALVMDGKVYHDTNSVPYFAITKDGKAVIRDAGVPLDDVKEAVGGWPVVLKNGELVNPGGDDDSYQNIPYSRTAIGIKANGDVVTLVTHGRINPVSYGMTMKEMGETLRGLGCVDGLILDGGGSSTYCVKYEGTKKLAVQNNPSDGKERLVSSTLFITSSAKPTGEFDHAKLTPNNTVYTPESTVEFKAIGVDSSGAAVEIPTDVKWQLSSESADLGTIDADTGKFTAGKKSGEVTVQMVQGTDVIGSTNITIAEPDSISFTNEEICLGFSKSSDLGLTVKYKGRNVNYKDGDFKWECIPDDENASRDDMGTFDGNIFTTSEGKSVNGKIRCESVYDPNVSGEIYAVIGRLPTIAMDFEDATDVDGNVIDAETYWLGKQAEDTDGDGIEDTEAKEGKITTKTYGRGGKESLSLVDVSDDEEHVRFDSKALKIDYDFTQAWGTEGAGVGFNVDQTIEGTPTAVGMWVYAPEGTANLWLRIRVNDADGQVQNLDFVPEIDKDAGDVVKAGKNWTGDLAKLGGINWEGWHYVEAQLTDKEGNPLKGPFELRTGEIIRVMYVPGTGMGFALPDGTYVGQAERKGSLYIDNVRFIYGANVDDLDAPKSEFITVDEGKFEDGITIKNNIMTIKASLYDEPGAYMSGLDWDRIHTYIDGKEIAFEQAGELLQISNLGLGNGEHEFKLVICDKFGNKATETRNFTVKGESDFTSINAQRVSEGDVYLNSTQKYDITVNRGEKLESFSADIQLNKLFAEDTFKLEFNENIEGTSEYNSESGILHIEGKVKADSQISGELKLAELSCYIAPSTAEGVKFRVGIKNGTYTLNEASEENQAATFIGKEFSSDVKAKYKLYADALVTGSDDGYIYVTDADGNAVSGAEVFLEDGTRLGVTGAKGYLKAKAITNTADTYKLYAVVNEDYTFITKVVVLSGAGNKDGYPSQLTSVVTNDPSSEKAVTWFSNPDAADKKAVMQIATTEDYKAKGVDAFEDKEGTVKIHNFTGSSDASKNGSVYINKVHVKGLEADKEYTYRVGDGNYWSDVTTFTLRESGTDTNLFIVGDCQSEDTANIDKIINNLVESGVEYNAGIQTGDLVDSGAVYPYWASALDIFSKNDVIRGTEILHVIGNHEREGDGELTAAESIYNMPNKNHYSVEYGNVYVATLSYAFSKSQLEADLKWLVEDAQKSDAIWKVVVTHQPAYYTNTAGSNELMHELLPPAAEKAGIDVVFSGHDHSYARTEPLKGGEVNKENGIVYYICGSTGEKSYSISDNADFHFAELNDSFDAIYLTVEATDKTFSVKTHELDGSVIDEYSIENKSECSTTSHDYIYDGSKYLKCALCGYAIKTEGYSGFAKDKATGDKMYLINGKFQTGWIAVGNEVYYFDGDGHSQKVTVKKEVKTECTTNGYKLYYCENASDSDGKEYKVQNGANAPGHEYDDNFVCKTCGWKAVALEDCKITTKYSSYMYTGKEIKPFVTVSYNGKVMNSYYDYRVTYENNSEIGVATAKLDPNVRLEGDKVTHRSSLLPGNVIEKNFTIAPKSAADLKSTTVGCNTIKLAWSKSDSAEGYNIYKYNATKKAYNLYKTVNASTLTCTVKDLKAGYSYGFRVNAYGIDKNTNKKVLSTSKYIKGITKPYKVEYLKLKAGTKSITASWNKRACTGYQVRYSSTSNFNSYKTITVKGNANVSKKISKLKTGKKYYVKVRAYKSLTGYKTVYGNWSAVRSVVVK